VEAPKSENRQLSTIAELSAVAVDDTDVKKKSRGKGKDKEGKPKDKDKKSKSKSLTEEGKTKKSKHSTASAPASAVDDLLGLGYADFLPAAAASSAPQPSTKEKSKKHSAASSVPPHAIVDPALNAFSPHEVDSEGFGMLISKSSSKWASGSITVPYNAEQKAKVAFKAIANRLHCYQVETEHSKACSFCGKHTSGSGFLFVLAKASSKDGGVITADVKCLLSSKQESQAVVDAVVASLSSMSFA
jgi:hypothetical protein